MPAAACRVVARRRRGAVARACRWRPVAPRCGSRCSRWGSSAAASPSGSWPPRGRHGRRSLVVGVLSVELVVSAVCVELGQQRRHDLPRPGGRRAPQPRSRSRSCAARRRRRRVRARRRRSSPDLAGERRALPHVGPAGGGVREGLPVHAAAVPTGRRSRWNAARCSRSATSLGYNPVQLPRYWDYLRARTRPAGLLQRRSVIDLPTSQDVRIAGRALPRDRADGHRRRRCRGRSSNGAQGYDLVELSTGSPTSRWCRPGPWWTRPPQRWRRLPPGFDPANDAVLESRPGLQPEPGAGPGTASAQETLSVVADHRRRAPPRRRIVVVRSTTTRAGPPPWTVSPQTSCPSTASCRGAGDAGDHDDRVGLRGRGPDPWPDRRAPWCGSAIAVGVRGRRAVTERRRRREPRAPTAPAMPGAGAP